MSEVASYAKTKEFWEHRAVPLVFTIAFTLGSPFLGLIVAGSLGVAVGLLASIVSLVVGFFAVTKVRDTERGGA